MSAAEGTSQSTDNTPDPARLIALIAGRSSDALSQLYDRFSHALRAIAIRVLSHDGEADDVLQEVFIKVWDHAPQYSAALGTPATWLITITRNAALNRLRARRRNMSAMERAAAEPPPGPPADPSAYECVVSAETATLVRDALAGLPEEQRIPIELAYMQGLTYEEVATRLGHPIGSVKSRLRRGMAHMKSVLIACDPSNHE